MSANQYIPDAEFAPAPAGTRLRLAILLSAVISVLVGIVLVAVVLRDPSTPRPVVAFGGVAPVMMAIVLWASRIRRYRLTGAELLVELRFRTVRFPLAGLVSLAADREAMRRAWKVYGNDGLGAISGRYRSRHLGPFRVYLTDAEHAVVLRWPDRCLVISPEQHSFFIESARKRAGLPR
jgi:Bacterial PH domain